MRDVELYATGIVNVSCCALKMVSRQEVEKSVNRQNPSGVSPWAIAKEEAFKNGALIPNQCEIHEDRQHWLLHC